MKQKILKSFLCLSLSAAMIFGEAGAAFATTVADTPEVVEAVAETETVAEPEMTEEGETTAEETTAEETTADETAVDELAEGEAAEAAPEEETAETEGITEGEAAQAEEETDDVLEALGAKIVAPTTLADVTGLAYDAKTKILSWNKVAGATGYKYEITYVDEAGKEKRRTDGSTGKLYLDLDNWSFTADRTYTVKVTAVNYGELYLVAADVPRVNYGDKYDETAGRWIYGYYDSDPDSNSAAKLLYEENKDYDEIDSKQVLSTSGTTIMDTLYKHPASANPAPFDVKPRTTLDDNAKENAQKNSVTALAGVALKELYKGAAVFEITPAAELQDRESVEYSYSNNEAFKNDDDDDQLFASDNITIWNNKEPEFSIDLSDFDPGDTIYIKARTFNKDYVYESKPGETKENKYSAYVTTTYTVPKAEIKEVSVTVTGSSVRLEPSEENGNVTGFEYQRKSGKKWATIAKQGGAYTDEGLKEDTTYTYRVRGYSYNTRTQKTTYTDWKQVSAYTWGAALNLKASAAGATSVKLKWSKIPKADGYEIYRYDTSSDGYTLAKGEWQESFSNATLIKTIKKAKTVTYTDKKLTKGNSYGYFVRAYRTIGKNKCYIQASAGITLSAKDTISGLTEYYNASGAMVVTWNKATGISGYKVEKYNSETEKWEAYKNLGKTATTITLPKVSAGSKSVQYRISSYNGKTRYATTGSIEVEPKLAAVKNVKAVQTAEGVQVTWSPVAGADYYQVIRTTREASSYDATTKTYPIDSVYGTSVAEAVYDTSSSADLAMKGAPEDVTTSYGTRIVVPAAATTVDEDGYRHYTDPSDGKTYPVSEDEDDDGNSYYYYNKYTQYTAKAYGYDPNLKATYDGKLYNNTTSYSTTAIKGTSVIDKQVTVQKLIKKENDPAYNKAADPEYFYTDSYGNGRYAGDYGEYAKNADGSLKTKTVVVEGPEAGNTYYYYVRACVKASNGANENSETTYSMGYTKGAQVTYTTKTAKETKLASVKSAKKATVVVSAKKVSGAKGYAFYRATKKNGAYVKVGTSTTPKYTDTNVTGGKTYYYKTASYTLTENGTFVYSKLSAPKSVKAKK